MKGYCECTHHANEHNILGQCTASVVVRLEDDPSTFTTVAVCACTRFQPVLKEVRDATG